MIGIHRYSNFPNKNILELVDMFIQVVDFNTKSKWDKNRIRIIGLLTPDENFSPFMHLLNEITKF